MTVGPVEYIVIEFPGNHFRGEIAPEVARLVSSGVVRILDVVFLTKDEAGQVSFLEIDAVEEEVTKILVQDADDLMGLLNDEDLSLMASTLPPNSSAVLIVWENAWATKFVEAVGRADGRILAHERVPHEAVIEALSFAQSEN